MSKSDETPFLEANDPELRQLLIESVEVLTGVSDINLRIDKLLDKAIAFYDSDRAYVIEGDTELVTGINTHERCAEGIESQQDTLKDMPPDVYTHWLGIFHRFENIVITDMRDVMKVRPNEYKYFNDSGVHSIIVVPFSKRLSQGFVGVDNPRRHVRDALPLRVLSYAVVLELNELKLTREKNALMQVSQYPEDSAYVHLLGQFEISAHGGTLYQDQFTQQGQALLTMLLLHPVKSFSSNEIYDIISQDKESDNPTSVVNNAIYRLRSNLDIIGLKELVQCVRGTYSLNPRFSVETDADRFLKFYQAAKENDEQERKLELCRSALQLYQNPLPESLSGSVRWTLECANMNTKFLNAALECVKIHIERGEYALAYEVAHSASDIDPHEPRMLLLMAKVMKLSNRPGLQDYVRKISRFLDKDARNQLAEIMDEEGKNTPRNCTESDL